MLNPRRIGVRKLVDQAQLGFPGEHGRQVHLLKRRPPVDDAPAGNDLQSLGLRDGLVATMGLEVANDDISPVVSLSHPLLQHPVGLPDPGSHTDEHLQMPEVGGHAGIVAYGGSAVWV